ncbi:otogelin-like [Petromyzon marinus]|uniref:otogelin-like n=1 Tax=Petromyzon marinus TaxID=7757 RepID=UPI003F72DD1E
MVMEAGVCIHPSECPCVYQRAVFPAGTVLNEGCGQCVCLAGQWNCTEHLCPAECSVIGDTHVTTFDGSVFTLSLPGDYVLVKTHGADSSTSSSSSTSSTSSSSTSSTTSSSSSAPPSVVITLHTAPCSVSLSEVCVQAVSVMVGDRVGSHVTVTRAGDVIVGSLTRVSIPYDDGAVRVAAASSLFLLLRVSAPPHHVTVEMERGGAGGGARLYLQLGPPAGAGGPSPPTLGLCGSHTDNALDDFTSPAGVVEPSASLFADSWRVTGGGGGGPEWGGGEEGPWGGGWGGPWGGPWGAAPVDPCDTNHHSAVFAAERCSVLTAGTVFAACRPSVAPAEFFSRCRGDACRCGLPCLCRVIADYARACRRLTGLLLDFRAHVKDCGSRAYRKVSGLTQALGATPGSRAYPRLSGLPQALGPTPGSRAYPRLTGLPQALGPTLGSRAYPRLSVLPQALGATAGSQAYRRLSGLPQALGPTAGSRAYHRLSGLPQALGPTRPQCPRQGVQ